MPVDSTPSTKKHRVIGWKPEGDALDTTNKGRYPRWVFITATVLGGLLVLLVITRTLGYVLREKERSYEDTIGGTVTGGNARTGDISQMFVDRSKAEFTRGEAMRAVTIVEKSPLDHPVILQRMMTIGRMRDAADKALGDRDYMVAVQRFEALGAEAKSLADTMEDRRRAKDGYNKFLVDETRLKEFKNLDPESYDSAITAAGASQTFLDQGSFTMAREKIEEAARTLDAIEQSIKAEIEENLSIGRAALTHGDGAAAQKAFGRTLELQRDNELATKGIARAKNIDAVFALVRAADKLEAAGKFEEAQANYEKAFALDGLSATAQAGTARMKSSIKKRDFERAILLAQEALVIKKWDDVIKGYEAALKVIPEDRDIQRKLAEARVQQRETRIQEMLASAYADERANNWESAKRTYLELIAYEPGQTDAEDGLLRTGKVIRAILVFEKKIEEARSQAQRANFKLAIDAFNEAMQSKPSYLELTSEQAQLKSTLERQSKPVQVTFISDGKTYVTINGLRMLNKFETMTVPILPGNYEVVGRRKGYEEVRQRLNVRADDPLDPIRIAANKKN